MNTIINTFILQVSTGRSDNCAFSIGFLVQKTCPSPASYHLLFQIPCPPNVWKLAFHTTNWLHTNHCFLSLFSTHPWKLQYVCFPKSDAINWFQCIFLKLGLASFLTGCTLNYMVQLLHQKIPIYCSYWHLAMAMKQGIPFAVHLLYTSFQPPFMVRKLQYKLTRLVLKFFLLSSLDSSLIHLE